MGKDYQVDKVIEKIKKIVFGYEDIDSVQVIEKIKPAVADKVLVPNQPSIDTVFEKIENTLLTSIDKSWDFAVDRTASTINYSLLPLKWTRVKVYRGIEFGLAPLSNLKAKLSKKSH